MRGATEIVMDLAVISAKAKVNKFYFSLFGDEHVLQFYVPVHDIL